MTIKEAADKWKGFVRQVQNCCKKEIISRVARVDTNYLISNNVSCSQYSIYSTPSTKEGEWNNYGRSIYFGRIGNGSRDVYQMLDSFIESKDILNALYNDPQKKLAVSLIREQLGDVKIDDDGLATIITDVSNESEYSNGLTGEAYIKLIKEQIEKNERNLLCMKVQQEWKRITYTDSIDNWAEEIKIPAWTVFADTDEKSDFIKLLSKPEDFSTDALKQQLSLLEMVSEISIEQCQANFMCQIIPNSYKKLDIKLVSLIKYLEQEFGSNPNEWPKHPDISGFVKEQYRVEIAPSIVNQLKHKDANTLKKRILELAMNDPDIGLRLLEL